MTKHPKWLNRPEEDVPEHIRNAEGGGRGLSAAMHDVAHWLPDEFDPWVAALEAIDKRNDKEPLIALLKSEHDLPQEARVFLADLLDRYELKPPAHRPRTPAYDRTPVEAALLLDIEAVRELIRNGMSAKDALVQVAKQRGPDYLEILGNAYEHRRGATNRINRRTRP